MWGLESWRALAVTIFARCVKLIAEGNVGKPHLFSLWHKSMLVDICPCGLYLLVAVGWKCRIVFIAHVIVFLPASTLVTIHHCTRRRKSAVLLDSTMVGQEGTCLVTRAESAFRFISPQCPWCLFGGKLVCYGRAVILRAQKGVKISKVKQTWQLTTPPVYNHTTLKFHLEQVLTSCRCVNGVSKSSLTIKHDRLERTEWHA